MKNSIKSLVAVAVLALASATAMAAQPLPVYVDAAIGASHIGVDGEESGLNVDRSGTGGKVDIGYKFNKNFAVEAGYLTLGKATASADGFNASLKSDGFTLGVAGFVPVTKDLTVSGRTGAYFSKNTVDASFGEYSGSVSERHTTPYVGVGVQYAVTKNVTLNGGLDFTRVKVDGGSYNGRLLSVGAGYQF